MIPFWVLQVDVSAPGPRYTSGQVILGWIVVVLVFLAVIALRYRNRYAGLEKSERRHKSKLAGSKRDQTPRVLRIPAFVDPETFRADIRSLFLGDVRPDELEHESVTLVDASRRVRGAFSEAWRPVTSRFSRMVLRLVSLAWLVALFGAIAVATDSVVRLILTDTSIGDPENLLSRAIEHTLTFLDSAADVLATFPYIGEIWALAFALATLLFEFLYNEWYLVPIALILTAVVIARLEQHVSDELETKLYEDRRRLVLNWVGGFALIWVVGVGPTAAGAYLFRPQLGATIGIGLAAVVATALSGVGLVRYIRRMKSVATVARTERTVVMLYLLARRTGISAAIPGSILLVSYAAVIVADGKAARVWDAFLAADIGIKGLAGFLVVGFLASLIYMVRSAWPDVRTALVESLAKSRVRAAVFYRGSVAIGFAVGYLLAFAFTRDVLLGLVLAAVGAFVAFVMYQLLERAKYRLTVLDVEERRPRSVTIQGWRLRDDDGDRHSYAVLNGDHELAREDVDDLVEEILDAVASYQDGEKPLPTIGSKHAETLLSIGRVEEQATIDRVEDHARKLLLDELRPVGQPTEKDDVEDACRDVPERSLQYWLDELLGKEIVDHGETLELVRDPWSKSKVRRGRV